jgi:hypothetical protein
MANGLLQPICYGQPRIHELDPLDPFAPTEMTFRVKLWVERADGDSVVPLIFLVDSGSSYPSIDLRYAVSRGLAVPPPEANQPLTLGTSTGSLPVTIRRGEIRCWWTEELTGHGFLFPILFRVSPPSPHPLLGLGGVIRLCRWVFDPPLPPQYPHGRLTLEDVRDHG